MKFCFAPDSSDPPAPALLSPQGKLESRIDAELAISIYLSIRLYPHLLYPHPHPLPRVHRRLCPPVESTEGISEIRFREPFPR